MEGERKEEGGRKAFGTEGRLSLYASGSNKTSASEQPLNTTQLNTTETNEPIASFTTVSRPSAHYQGRASADMLVTSAY